MTMMKNFISSISSSSMNNNAQTTTSSSTINNRKRILIDEFLQSNDDRIKEFQLDDHAIEAMFDCLEHPERDIELFKLITKRLYELYRSQDRQLRLITLIFLPTLIGVYIRYHHAHSSSFYHQHSKISSYQQQQQLSLEPNSSIAVLLLCVYNFEIIHQKTGELKTIDVRLVSLSKPSIYHEPNVHTLSSTIPTEQMLAKINNPNETKITIFGPYPEVLQLNTGNQQSVFTVLMKLYNQHIQEVGFYSMQSLCRLYGQLLRQGSQIDLKQKIKTILQQSSHHLQPQMQQLNNENGDDDDNENHYRPQAVATPVIIPDVLQIFFTSDLLTELMKSAHFCFYNELEDLASDLIDEIAKRATYKLYSDVILMVNAFKNSQAIINRDREDHVAKMKRMNQSEISLNATPPVSSVTSVSSRKAAITNASFKTRKLPDDIPIVTSTTTTNTASALNINAGLAIQQNIHGAPPLTKQQQKLVQQQLRSIQQQQQQLQLPHSKQNGRPHHSIGGGGGSSFMKSLDSIYEEASANTTQSSSPITKQPPSQDVKSTMISSNKSTPNQQQQSNHIQPTSGTTSTTTGTKPPKKSGVIQTFLKELKDKPKKSSKSQLISSNSNPTTTPQIVVETSSNNGKFLIHHQSNNNSIDGEVIPLKFVRKSKLVNDEQQATIPLAPLERFDEDEDEVCLEIDGKTVNDGDDLHLAIGNLTLMNNRPENVDEDNDNDDDDDDDRTTERLKLRIERSSSDGRSDSDGSSGSTSAVALLANNNNATGSQNKDQQQSTQMVIKSESNSKYSTPTMSIH